MGAKGSREKRQMCTARAVRKRTSESQRTENEQERAGPESSWGKREKKKLQREREVGHAASGEPSREEWRITREV